MEVLEYINQTNHADSIESLVSLFRQSISRFGYTKFCSFTRDGLRPEIISDDPEEAHYSTEFYGYYMAHQCRDIDPVYKMLLRTRHPFSWEQLQQLPLSKEQRRVMALRERSCMYSGVSMPIRCADHETIGMSVASPHRDGRNDPGAIAALYAFSNQFYMRRAQLLGHDDFELPNITLSPRERDILHWCMEGKSNSVIGSILGISEKTVEFHFSSIFRKLSVASRTAAVLKAVNMKLVHA